MLIQIIIGLMLVVMFGLGMMLGYPIGFRRGHDRTVVRLTKWFWDRLDQVMSKMSDEGLEELMRATVELQREDEIVRLEKIHRL